MVNAQRKPFWISPEDYLAAEQASPRDRHEYVDGEVYLMTGGTLAHNTLALNLGFALRQHLKGSPCRVQVNDVRLHVAEANCYFYPDLLVHCGATSPSDTSVSDARLVVEVLSPSTAGYDRFGKFAKYRKLASLQEYVLVNTDLQWVEVYRRAEGEDWWFHAYNHAETIVLKSLDFRLAVAELYAESGVEQADPAEEDQQTGALA